MDSIELKLTYRPKVVFVRAGANGKNDGTSCEDAFFHIEEPLSPWYGYVQKKEIWLASGNINRDLLISSNY
jgi:hypothetical protein